MAKRKAKTQSIHPELPAEDEHSRQESDSEPADNLANSEGDLANSEPADNSEEEGELRHAGKKRAKSSSREDLRAEIAALREMVTQLVPAISQPAIAHSSHAMLSHSSGSGQTHSAPHQSGLNIPSFGEAHPVHTITPAPTPASIQLFSKVERLTRLDAESISRVLSNIKEMQANGKVITLSQICDFQTLSEMNMHFKAYKSEVDGSRDFMQWPLEALFTELLRCVPPETGGSDISPEERLKRVELGFSAKGGGQKIRAYIHSVGTILGSHAAWAFIPSLVAIRPRTVAEVAVEKTVCEILMRQMQQQAKSAQHAAQMNLCEQMMRPPLLAPTTWEDLGTRLLETNQELMVCQQLVNGYYKGGGQGPFLGYQPPVPGKPKLKPYQGGSGGAGAGARVSRISPAAAPSVVDGAARATWPVCRGCGRAHNPVTCHLENHPDFNKSSAAWADSHSGRAYSRLNLLSIPKGKRLSSDKSSLAEWSFPKRDQQSHEYRGEPDIVCMMCQPSIPASAFPNTHCLITKSEHIIPTNNLFDSGALQGNYMSAATAKKLSEAGHVVSHCDDVVCSVFKQCLQCVGKLHCNIRFYDVHTQPRAIFLEFKILDILPYDTIIGREAMIKYNLFPFVRHTLSDDPTELVSWLFATHPTATPDQRGTQTRVTTSTLRMSKREVLDMEPDDDGESDDLPSESGEVPHYANIGGSSLDEILKLIDIKGTPEEQSQLHNLVSEYKDIFCTSVHAIPAKLTPMELEVDASKWNHNRNRGAARVQTRQKQEAVVEMVTKMLKAGVIKPSQASEYSQVHLVNKDRTGATANNFRFTIDYRNLNAACKSLGWPLPNIKQLLQRLGAKRSRYFAVVDLTSGYHQAPLSQRSQEATAFITHMGVFQWCRVPMGLKSAGSYFQQQLANEVLVGSIYHICESYLDDVIIHGDTLERYMANIRTVFARFRKHHITLNPAKCRFGHSEIEYVGHVINQDGITFSRDKIMKVLQIPKPIKEKELKSFLGLANYFRDHVANHSTTVHPLNELLRNYTRSKRIQWNTEAESAFTKIKEDINQCPFLFFLDDFSPVTLHTDASDYGIGAYLFQTVDGIEKPIAFVSHALSASQITKWSTPEKEAYAIFYALGKLDYLLRDIKFTLHTDHKNLTLPFLNNEQNARVKRWKLAIQQYDFDVEYIKGAENIVADGFSRLISTTPDMLNTINEFALSKEQKELLGNVHNSVVGHVGVDKTIERLLRNEREPWPFMRQHVQWFIKRCPCCQKQSVLNIKAFTKPFTTARYEPFECINIDSIGPLDADEFGSRYIIVIIDCFTRFVELVATTTTDAVSAARAVFTTVGRSGCPSQILTDNGTQYRNEFFQTLCDLMGIEVFQTLAYSKEENGLVERANKEVMRHLRAIIFDRNVKHNWSRFLPLVQRIMNATVHESIGASPAQLLFGNAINLDRRVILDRREIFRNIREPREQTLNQWAEEMIKAQAAIIKASQEHQRIRDDAHIVAHDPRRTEFAVNSYVLVNYPHNGITGGPPSKLLTHKKGPFRVVNNVGSTYTVENLVNNKLEDYHISSLTKFEYDVNEVDPRLIANRDSQMWDVEAVIAHRGDPKGSKRQLFFLIKWVGFDASQNTWEPWENVRDTAALQAYLTEKKLRSLIPQKFRVAA